MGATPSAPGPGAAQVSIRWGELRPAEVAPLQGLVALSSEWAGPGGDGPVVCQVRDGRFQLTGDHRSAQAGEIASREPDQLIVSTERHEVYGPSGPHRAGLRRKRVNFLGA